jgi:HD-like signal output (HDOD) protein
MRLGMATTCTLATGLAMEQMFQATSDMVDKRLRQVWTTSSEVAGMCTVLCKLYTKLRPEQATLAGLVHKIGILPILSYAEDHPSLLKDSITLDSIIQATHPHIGQKILSTWEFPKDIRDVPVDHLNFGRKIPAADYADIVIVAVLQAQPEQFKSLDYYTVTAFERLGIDPDIESAEGKELGADLAQGATLFR